MSPPMVGVHGIGNRRSGPAPAAAEALGARWTAAGRRGLGATAPASVAVAYYAHLLAREAPQSSAGIDHLDEREQALLLEWAAQLGAPDEVAQGRLTAPARVVADWIARRFDLDTALVRRFTAVFCREVVAYLHTPQRETVRRAVAGTIREHSPRVVLAHSLGSVVAYETLWAHPELEIDLLVTLGSPLGMPGVVFPGLDPRPVDGMGRRPPGVRRWVNVADPGDPVAVPRAGLASCFHGVDADLTASNGLFDFHRVTGYLAGPATAGVLAATL